jgi:hypothetical protein
VDVELTHFYLKPSLLRVQDADMAMYASFIMACLHVNLSIFCARSICMLSVKPASKAHLTVEDRVGLV